MLRIEINVAARTSTPAAASQNENADTDFGLVLGQLLINKVYRFQAEMSEPWPELAYGTNAELALWTLEIFLEVLEHLSKIIRSGFTKLLRL